MPRRKTQEEFEKDVFDRLGPSYVLLEPYPGAHGKVLMRHEDCGNTFKKNVHDIITKGSGCPYCNGNRSALYNVNWVKEHTPLPYHYVSGYTKMSEKCTFHCDKCNIDFQQTPSRIINEHIYGCDCCPTKQKTHEQFLEELGEDCLQEYKLLDIYVNDSTDLGFIHKPCGTKFYMNPDKFLRRNHKKYCPACYHKKSKGEALIAFALTKYGFEFQAEKSFSELGKHRFDFWIPQLQTLIEFDGEQHIKPIEHFGGEAGFKERQIKDKMKNEFCLRMGYPLYRIPYSDIDNIDRIIREIFKEESSTTIEKYLVTE